jgi:hypothetical protein
LLTRSIRFGLVGVGRNDGGEAPSFVRDGRIVNNPRSSSGQHSTGSPGRSLPGGQGSVRVHRVHTTWLVALAYVVPDVT